MPTFDPDSTDLASDKPTNDYYAPDGSPWCKFRKGSLECVNEAKCKNPNHIGLIEIEGRLRLVEIELRQWIQENRSDSLADSMEFLIVVNQLETIIADIERSHADTTD